MAWDTEGTKRKILDAAVIEFAHYGPDAATIDRIAKSASINKERIYNYFGDKRALFAAVLRHEMAKAAQALPIPSFANEDIGLYAGRVYDYHCQHPQLSRLMRWEGLVFSDEVPDEAVRKAYYQEKIAAVTAGQQSGDVSSAIASDHLMFLIFALAGWWSAVPQVARMFAGQEDVQEHARRRASVVAAARRLAAVD